MIMRTSTMPKIEDLHRLSKVAKDFRVSPQTLYSAAQSGYLRTWKTACGLMLTTKDEVERWGKDSTVSRQHHLRDRL